ncbi:hypothetical protein EBR96_05380 [bacterium]|nr:hypothetical protein [bacterium]
MQRKVSMFLEGRISQTSIRGDFGSDFEPVFISNCLTLYKYRSGFDSRIRFAILVFSPMAALLNAIKSALTGIGLATTRYSIRKVLFLKLYCILCDRIFCNLKYRCNGFEAEKDTELGISWSRRLPYRYTEAP